MIQEEALTVQVDIENAFVVQFEVAYIPNVISLISNFKDFFFLK